MQGKGKETDQRHKRLILVSLVNESLKIFSIFPKSFLFISLAIVTRVEVAHAYSCQVLTSLPPWSRHLSANIFLLFFLAERKVTKANIEFYDDKNSS